MVDVHIVNSKRKINPKSLHKKFKNLKTGDVIFNIVNYKEKVETYKYYIIDGYLCVLTDEIKGEVK